jgi:hypothetical protein
MLECVEAIRNALSFVGPRGEKRVDDIATRCLDGGEGHTRGAVVCDSRKVDLDAQSGVGWSLECALHSVWSRLARYSGGISLH